jgi:L-fuculose-phosphate aldolase
MANHGAISYGKTLLEAFQKMETVEHLAHIALVAHQLGSPQPLSVDQVDQLHHAKTKYVQNAAVNIGVKAPGPQIVAQRMLS